MLADVTFARPLGNVGAVARGLLGDGARVHVASGAEHCKLVTRDCSLRTPFAGAAAVLGAMVVAGSVHWCRIVAIAGRSNASGECSNV
jgi:hypothetical protein